MYSTHIFFICNKLSSLTAKIGKPEKWKFGKIDSWSKFLLYEFLLRFLWDSSSCFPLICIFWMKSLKTKNCLNYWYWLLIKATVYLMYNFDVGVKKGENGHKLFLFPFVKLRSSNVSQIFNLIVPGFYLGLAWVLPVTFDI